MHRIRDRCISYLTWSRRADSWNRIGLSLICAQRRMFCKSDFCSILSLIVFSWTTFDLAWGQLIRPVYVYEGLIKSIHDYFNNTCIILLHNNPNPIETQGENRMRKQNIAPIKMIWHASAIDSLYILKSRALQDSRKANTCWFFRNTWVWLITYAPLSWIFICSAHEWAFKEKRDLPFFCNQYYLIIEH